MYSKYRNFQVGDRFKPTQRLLDDCGATIRKQLQAVMKKNGYLVCEKRNRGTFDDTMKIMGIGEPHVRWRMDERYWEPVVNNDLPEELFEL